VSCSSMHCIALEKETGAVYAWAKTSTLKRNQFGELGRGFIRTNREVVSLEELATPKMIVEVGTGCLDVCAGGSSTKVCDGGHSLVIDKKEQVWAMGCNRWFQLGRQWETGASYEARPRKVLGMENCRARSVAGGKDHSLVLCSNGNVIGFGRSGMGQVSGGVVGAAAAVAGTASPTTPTPSKGPFTTDPMRVQLKGSAPTHDVSVALKATAIAASEHCSAILDSLAQVHLLGQCPKAVRAELESRLHSIDAHHHGGEHAMHTSVAS
jgi:hypothetical protein